MIFKSNGSPLLKIVTFSIAGTVFAALKSSTELNLFKTNGSIVVAYFFFFFCRTAGFQLDLV